jgi:hypothetical protein
MALWLDVFQIRALLCLGAPQIELSLLGSLLTRQVYCMSYARFVICFMSVLLSACLL